MPWLLKLLKVVWDAPKCVSGCPSHNLLLSQLAGFPVYFAIWTTMHLLLGFFSPPDLSPSPLLLGRACVGWVLGCSSRARWFPPLTWLASIFFLFGGAASRVGRRLWILSEGLLPFRECVGSWLWLSCGVMVAGLSCTHYDNPLDLTIFGTISHCSRC